MRDEDDPILRAVRDTRQTLDAAEHAYWQAVNDAATDWTSLNGDTLIPGRSIRRIADAAGVSRSAISRILGNKG
jgi:hypothetical protein